MMHAGAEDEVQIGPGDALVVVDMQRDFMPGGPLPVEAGDGVIAPVNLALTLFCTAGLPVFASRDWHPGEHCSFSDHGGTWPSHCVAGTSGAGFADGLALPHDVRIVSKATRLNRDAYSAFGHTDLERRLSAKGIKRLVVCGLATDHCVLRTVLDAIDAEFDVIVLVDAVAALELHSGDGERALAQMAMVGARFSTSQALVDATSCPLERQALVGTRH
jgi:nicotinamidase/pyrazinamidase